MKVIISILKKLWKNENREVMEVVSATIWYSIFGEVILWLTSSFWTAPSWLWFSLPVIFFPFSLAMYLCNRIWIHRNLMLEKRKVDEFCKEFINGKTWISINPTDNYKGSFVYGLFVGVDVIPDRIHDDRGYLIGYGPDRRYGVYFNAPSGVPGGGWDCVVEAKSIKSIDVVSRPRGPYWL